MFDWDPDQYRRYADERSRPFGDLVARLAPPDPQRVLDLGCGDGALTATLSARWTDATVIGVDSSADMIRSAQARATDRLAFRQADVARLDVDRAADVVVSNAMFQWVPDHLDVLRRWAGALAAGSWFAFQVPGNFDAPSHRLLRELAGVRRWARLLPADLLRHDDAVATPADYADLFLDAGWRVDAWETTYVHLLSGTDPVLEWVRGTGLRPLLAALPADEIDDFVAAYAQLLRTAYPPRHDGITAFEFRRIFCVAHR